MQQCQYATSCTSFVLNGTTSSLVGQGASPSLSDGSGRDFAGAVIPHLREGRGTKENTSDKSEKSAADRFSTYLAERLPSDKQGT